MNRGKIQESPTFLWQGLLILMPVLILCGVGVYFLQRDKALARHDAVENATAIADDLLQRVSGRLASCERAPVGCRFQVSREGKLLSPPARTSVPDPHPLDSGQLTRRQLDLWTGAQQGASDSATSQMLQALLDSDPPPDFAANALLNWSAILLEQADVAAAREKLELLLAKYPEARGESGFLLRTIAEWKLVDASLNDAGDADTGPEKALSNLCSNLVTTPNFLTPKLLDQAAELPLTSACVSALRLWSAKWDSDERARDLFDAAFVNSDRRPGVGTFWFVSGVRDELPRSWLSNACSDNPGWFVCYPEAEVRGLLATALHEVRRVPPYLGFVLEVANRKLTPTFQQTGTTSLALRTSRKPDVAPVAQEQVLPFAFSSLSGTGGPARVAVYLSDPDSLYHEQRKRALWFSMIVLAATGAALAGFVAAYQAFWRQQRLSELKSNFVSSVSHELRAPVASVRLMAESLERGVVPEVSRRQEYFRLITQECRRLSSLVDNVLDFSRIEQGRKQYEFEPTDVLRLLEQTVKLMEPAAAERGLVLKLDVPHVAEVTPLEPSMDGRAVQQALINLIDNAVKHSRKGGVVTVGLGFDSDTFRNNLGSLTKGEETLRPGASNNHERVRLPRLVVTPRARTESEESSARSSRFNLWVEDRGEGIPATEHEKIFERFYRCGSELTRETQGVGIGLSIVKHVVEAHGGKVKVRSAPGEGSRFTLELPWGLPHGT